MAITNQNSLSCFENCIQNFIHFVRFAFSSFTTVRCSAVPDYRICKGINADPDLYPAVYSTTSISFYRTYLKETLVLFYNLQIIGNNLGPKTFLKSKKSVEMQNAHALKNWMFFRGIKWLLLEHRNPLWRPK